jgi:hypothetical protein
MDDSDILEIAQTAIFRVSEIALALRAKGSRLCHSLGAELFITWYALNALTYKDEESMRELVSKLLRDVERICSVAVSTVPSLQRILGKAGPSVALCSTTISMTAESCSTLWRRLLY